MGNNLPIIKLAFTVGIIKYANNFLILNSYRFNRSNGCDYYYKAAK